MLISSFYKFIGDFMTNLSKIKRDDLISKSKLIMDELDDDLYKSYVNELVSELFEKKYGLVWEKHCEHVDEDLITKIPVFNEIKEKELVSTDADGFNFILEGDNLHSLKLLEKTHKNRIDVIYIDPPYNTGSKDWKYNNNYIDKNDKFRHSKWLSMMHNRLIIAKKLLTDDGVLICAIDENEQATLRLLLEDIFGMNYSIDCITIEHNPRGVQGDNFSYTHEYALFVYKKGSKIILDRLLNKDEITSSPLRNWGSESERADAKNCFYPIYIKNNEIIGFGDVISDESIHPDKNEILEDNVISVYPIDTNGIERKWRYARNTVEDIVDLLEVKKRNGVYDINIKKIYGKYKTVWVDKKFDANEYGTQLIRSMVPNNDFSFPKSLYNVYECLFAVLRDKPNAIILDFFAGSGTTGHAVELLNKKCGGCRKFILATNNAIGEKKEKEFKRNFGDVNQNLEEWEEWVENYGIASSITYPRIKAVQEGFTHNKKFRDVLYEKNMNFTAFKNSNKILEEIDKIKQDFEDNYSNFEIDFSDKKIRLFGVYDRGEHIDGIPFNLKYYKVDFLEKNFEGLVSSELIKHIKELIQLQNHINIPNDEIKIILSEKELDSMDADEIKKFKYIFISSEVFLTSQQENIFKNEDINLIKIPRYYFTDELRELREI